MFSAKASRQIFPVDNVQITAAIAAIDPVEYARSRNFLDGAVTRLSPYISRGVISTKTVFESLVSRGFEFSKIEKLVQELAWREYWQRIWQEKSSRIDHDLRTEQWGVENHAIPQAVISAETGIAAIDDGIDALYEIGYVHNHVRMYIASLACNIGRSHWLLPARWMYFHLLDGDWASNSLSWQWVAGTNSGKKYFANQENINKYCGTDQKATMLDVDYGDFESMPVPSALADTCKVNIMTELPRTEPVRIDPLLPTLIYNYYNLDPNWRKGEEANRVMLLEPSVFERYPVSTRCLGFALDLAKTNIEGVQIFSGEFDELIESVGGSQVIYKEHPLNRRYRGIEEPREWIFDQEAGDRSFFGYWKACQKHVPKQYQSA